MQQLSTADAMRGLLSQLAVEGYRVIPYHNKPFHLAMIATSSWLQKKAGSYGIQPQAWFVRNSSGQSFAVRYALGVLWAEGLIRIEGKSWDTLVYATYVDYARHIVHKTPGGEPFFQGGTTEFLSHYPIEKTSVTDLA